MVLETSALVSIVRGEDDAEDLELKLEAASEVYLSAVSYVECCMVLIGKKSDHMLQALDDFLDFHNVRIEVVTMADATQARDAFLRYGKGRHRAGLNFGDCFSYALSKRLGQPLLYKGEDFSRTDIQAA